MKMTIIRGISQHDEDQQVPEINPDVMHLGLERQRSLMLGNLPDFTSLLESLNTPTLKVNFDFASEIQSEAADQALVEQFNFENIESSFYPESQNFSQLKNIRMVERSQPDSVPVNYSQPPQYQPSSPTSVPSPSSSSGYSSDINNMGIDNETENTCVSMVGNGFEIKTEPGRDESEQKSMEELTRKMDRCCSQLNIPRDPTLWSSHQVQQWTVWISRECYNSDYIPLHQLQVDGTTLCMLQQNDFIMRFGNEQLGQLLFIELEIWRNALCIETETRKAVLAEMQRQQQQQQQHQQLMQQHQQQMLQHQQQQQMYHQSRVTQTADQPVYTDLSNSTAATYSITNIPTPVLSSHDMTLTLNEINQTLSHDMYNSSQICAAGGYQQLSPCSNLGSSGRGGWEDSSESGNSNYGNEYLMADDEDSRASTPLNHVPTIAAATTTTATPVRKPVVHKKYGAAVGHTKHTIHLWQFLRELLMSPNLFNNCIRWVDQRKGIFKIEDSTRVAKLWGERKNRPAMNYDKLSRSIRQYYKKGIIKKTEQSKRLVYQFCEQYCI